MWGLPRPGRRIKPHSSFPPVLVLTRAAESAGALGGSPDGRLPQLDRDVVSEHDLGDSLAVNDSPRLWGIVAHDDHPLFRVVGVDRSGRVGNGESMLERLAAPRPNLCFHFTRKTRAEAGRDERHFPRLEHDSPLTVALVGLPLVLRHAVGTANPPPSQIGPEIVAGGASRGACGKHHVVV